MHHYLGKTELFEAIISFKITYGCRIRISTPNQSFKIELKPTFSVYKTNCRLYGNLIISVSTPKGIFDQVLYFQRHQWCTSKIHSLGEGVLKQ